MALQEKCDIRQSGTDKSCSHLPYGQSRYYSLDYYLKERFGHSLVKLSLNGGMTCPNRDGTIGRGGCIFCSAGGSGEHAAPMKYTITQQLAYEKRQLGEKAIGKKYIAYFQAFTNTYGKSAEELRDMYTEAIMDSDVEILSIATRPDCLPEEIIELLRECSRIKPVWVELGLQTMHSETAALIRRGYELPAFEQAVMKLSQVGIAVIVHVILGLPGETEEMMLETISYLNRLPIDGIKLQLLHVLTGTDLAKMYENGSFQVLEQDAYVNLICNCIGHLREDIVIHRLTGDGPKELLIAPTWSRDKKQILNQIRHQLKADGIVQGKLRQADRI